MGELTVSPIQDKIITLLKGRYLPVRHLARDVYGVTDPTRSQMETIRQALRSLEGEDYVRVTRFVWDRQRCWELTGKLVPIPEKKKEKPIAVFKPGVINGGKD